MHGSRVNMPSGGVRVQQIIVMAMTLGCAVFLAVAVAVAGSPKELANVPTITFLFSVVAGILVMARAMVPRIVFAAALKKMRQGPRDSDITASLTQAMTTRLIVAAALIEGAVFLLIVAYFVERSPLSLAFAIVLIVLLAIHIPTTSRFESQLQNHLQGLEQEQSF